jgi:hypothetical protein
MTASSKSASACTTGGAADRAIGERVPLEVLRVENQIGRKVGIFVAPRIEQPGLQYNPLKETLVGKAPSVPVNQKGMQAAQLVESRTLSQK